MSNASLSSGGGGTTSRVRTFATKIADYTVTLSDDIIFVTTGGSNRTMTLPTAASASGYSFTIMKIDSTSTTVIIDGNGAETICGAATLTLDQQWLSAEVFSNGTSWVVL